MIGFSHPYVAVGAAAVGYIERVVRFFYKQNPDDILWDFSTTYREAKSHTETFSVPGHPKSKHWLRIAVRQF
jgi:hypothetical protein